jgi:hypothetical protein
VPFHRELGAVQMKYDQMSSALDRQHPTRVRRTACHLALAWLRVEAAFIRLIACPPAELGLGQNARRERLALTASNYVVRSLLRRALDETSSWTAARDELRALRVILRWLHERLEACSTAGLPEEYEFHREPDRATASGGRRRGRPCPAW